MVEVIMLMGILSILIGIAILIWPHVLNYFIAGYLLLIGILQVLSVV
jgi:hypothetical protein